MHYNFSQKERLALVNQYDILAKLSEGDEKKHYESFREIFRNGYEWGYNLVFETIDEDGVTAEECQFAHNVLSMYGNLYLSWRANKEAQATIEEDDVLFKGFDLNDSFQVKLLSFIEFVINDLGRYDEIKELMSEGKIDSLNSHGSGPSFEDLKNMVSKYKEIKKNRMDRGYELSIDQMKEILEA
ncbi:YfbU family protein [Rossellomorea marisflavi]|uniref:YfbU family protein n=1 Tax=Rossellomorea marisflavi TaxID=189381 RepID=UPI003458CCF6